MPHCRFHIYSKKMPSWFISIVHWSNLYLFWRGVQHFKILSRWHVRGNWARFVSFLQPWGRPRSLQDRWYHTHGCDEIYGMNKTMGRGEQDWLWGNPLQGATALTNATKDLEEELDKHFPHQEVTCALGICYARYWLTCTIKVAHPKHIPKLKTKMGQQRSCRYM